MGDEAAALFHRHQHVLVLRVDSLSDQLLVSAQGSATGRKTQYERLGTLVCIDALYNVICCPLSNLGSGVLDN